MEPQALSTDDTTDGSAAGQAHRAREQRLEHLGGNGEPRARTEPATWLYHGNFLVVTTAVSPYADPSAFVEEGVPQDAEFQTNYPHLDVLARPNPRRFVEFTPAKSRAKQTHSPMRVTTPNRHTEIMVAVERSLRKLYADQQAGHEHRLSGGFDMQEVNVVRMSTSASAGHGDTDRLPSNCKYVELPSDVCPTVIAGCSNVWMHVTHRDEAPSVDFQTPATKFAFDLSDARSHIRASDDSCCFTGVPWVASDADLSKGLRGPSAERLFPAHSQSFLEHIASNSDIVAEHYIMSQADSVGRLTPSQVEARKQRNERLGAGSSTIETTELNMKLYDVKVELSPLEPSQMQTDCAGDKPYLVGVLVYSYSAPHYLLELDYGGFCIAPSGSRDDTTWNVTGSVDGESSDLLHRQVCRLTII